MASTFTAGRIATSAAKPMFEQLADQLRSAIQSGELSPGDELPTEHELSAQSRVSRPTVRAALDVLVNEGWVLKRRALPTVVAAPEPIRHVASSRYQHALDQLRAGNPDPNSAFALDHGIAWPPHIETDVVEDDPTDEERVALELEPDDLVFRRTMVKYDRDDRATILQYSTMPAALVAGNVTALAETITTPVPWGTEGELYTVFGIEVTKVGEKIRSRPRRAIERQMLDLGAVPWVFEVRRTFYRGNPRTIPVEFSVVVASARRYEFEFETELT